MSTKEVKIEWKKLIQKEIKSCKDRIKAKSSILTALYKKNIESDLSEFDYIFEKRRYQIDTQVQLNECISKIHQHYLETDRKYDKKIKLKESTDELVKQAGEIFNEMNKLYSEHTEIAEKAGEQLSKKDSEYTDEHQKYNDIKQIHQQLLVEKKYMTFLKSQNKKDNKYKSLKDKDKLQKLSSIICKINAINPEKLKKYETLINDAISSQDNDEIDLIKRQLDLVHQRLNQKTDEQIDDQAEKLTTEEEGTVFAEKFINEKFQEKTDILKKEYIKRNYVVIDTLEDDQKEGYYVYFDKNKPTLIKYISNEISGKKDVEDKLKGNQFCDDTLKISKDNDIQLTITNDEPKIVYKRTKPQVQTSSKATKRQNQQYYAS